MKNKNFLKKLTAGILGFVMTLGVGAAGYSGAVSETKAAKVSTDYIEDCVVSSSSDFSTSAKYVLKSSGGYYYNGTRASDWGETATTLSTAAIVTLSGSWDNFTIYDTVNSKYLTYAKGKFNVGDNGVSCKIGTATVSGKTYYAVQDNNSHGLKGNTGSSNKFRWYDNLTYSTSMIPVQLIKLKSSVVHTVSISSGPDSIYKGNIGEYTATCSPAGDTVSSWTIINANPSGCATIDSSGKVTAKAQGTATVKVTSSGGVSAEKNITINNNNLVLSDKPIIGESGGTSQLSPKFDNWIPSTTPTYSYSSDNTSIATVSTSGLITFGSTTGTTKVHCTTTVNTVNFSGEVSVTTTTSDPTAQLSKDKSTPYYTGDTYTVTAAYSNIQQADTIIRMIHNGVNTDKTNVSSVTGTFSEAGDYDFVVLNKNDSKQISETLTISVTASSITDIEIYDVDTGEEVTELNFTLPTDASKTVELAARVTGVGHYSSTVTWSSSAPTKVSVGSSSGVVQPLGKVSNATITATAEGGKTATITVNVDKMGETESVTFANCGYSNQEEVTSYSFTNSSVTFDKGSNSNSPKYYDSGTAIRLYGGGTITISSQTLNIVKIELIYGTSDGSNAFSTEIGEFAETTEKGTWTGSSKSVVFTEAGTSGNRRIAGINVTYEAAADITSITLTGSYKTAYATNQKFDATGLGVSIGYDEGDPGADTYAANPSKFAFYKSNSFIDANKLTSGTSSINSVSNVYVVYNGNTEFAQSYDVTVTSHTVTVSSAGDATSVLAKATLQMSATHDAGDLKDDAITWSVKAANGTSSTTAASISDSGLLTGGTVTSATTVTVIATCKYGGSGSKQITINPHTINLSGSATAVINRAYSFTCTHNGSDAVSYKVVDPDNIESSPESTSFTPTSIGTYKITASCSCCLESNELDVVVGYAAIENVVVKHNGEIASSISTLINTTIRNLSAVAFDEDDETNTVSQQFTWSIDYEHSTDITASDVTFDSTEPSVTSSKAGTLVLVATSNQDNSKKASVSITFNSVSADITYPEGALDVYYGEQAKILTAASIGFTNPVYNWSTEWTGEGNCPIGITEVPGTAMAALSYNGVTPSEGVVVKLVVTESSDPTVSAAATKTVIVRSSGVDSLKIKKDNVDVTNTTVEIWDNGDAATFTYDITSHGIVSETAVWSLSSGADSLVSTSQSGGVITITSKNKIAADGTFTLTATNTSTYGDPAETTASVTVKVKKSSVTVTLPTNLPEIYNGENGSVAVTVSSTGNITDAQKTVTYSKSTANSSEINSAFSIEQSGLSCSISVLEAYPISSSEGFYITVTNDYDNSSQDIYVKVLHSRIEDFDIDSTTAQKTIYASEDTKNTVNLSASMTTYGCATNEVDWSIPDGETAIELNKTQSASGEEITITANPNYDFGSYDSHTVTLTATSHYDTSKTDTISIVVKREYVNKLEWTGGSNIDIFEGLTLSTGWGFKATYSSSKTENPSLGIGDNNVHVYIVDDANITTEPTDLTPVTSTQILVAADNGKYLVAFYQGVKCSSTFSITATDLLHKIEIPGKSGTVSFNETNTTGGKSGGGASVTATIDGVSLNVSSGYRDTSKNCTRVYSGATITIQSSVPITQVELTNVSGYSQTLLSVPSGGSGTYSNGVWTGSSTKVQLKASAQYRYSNLKVTFGDPTPIEITNNHLTAQKAVVDYARWFLSNCDSKSWSQLESEYTTRITNVLSNEEDLAVANNMFKLATHTGTNLDILQQCVEKYDQLRYKNSSLTDFLNRGTQAVQFTVTLDKANGDPIEYIKVNAGGTYTLPDAPKKGSYDFQYWDVGGDQKNPNDKITVSDNVTVTAVYSEQIKMSTDIAFQFTGLTMTKGEVKFGVNFDETKGGLKEYGFLVTTNTSLDPTKLTEDDVLGVTPTGFNKVKNKETAVVASKNLALDLKVVFYYIDDTGIHFSDVIVTSFEDIAKDYDSTTITDKYAKACFDVYQASLKNADKGE